MVDVRRDDDPAATTAAAGLAARRERVRRELRDDIKQAARELLVPHSTGELSLRAVARQVGLAPSGIYRYFASRQDLVAAVAADAYSSAARALHDSLEATREADHAAQALAMAHAYREWCLANRAEFSLMFGTEAGSDETRAVVNPAQLHEFFDAPLAHFARGVRLGAIDLERASLAEGTPLLPELEALRVAAGEVLDERAIGVLLGGWASFHGFVSLEVYGPLSWFYADLGGAFDRHARSTLGTMGYRGLAEVGSTVRT